MATGGIVMQVPHVKDKTDLEEIEKEVICKDYDSLINDGLLDSIKGVGL